MALRRKRGRRLLEKAISLLWPSPDPAYAITHFDDGDFVVACRGLHCGVGREDDGTWSVCFNVWITTRAWYGRLDSMRKVPSTRLQEAILEILGIKTTLEDDPTYPSLIGRVHRRPAPVNCWGR